MSAKRWYSVGFRIRNELRASVSSPYTRAKRLSKLRNLDEDSTDILSLRSWKNLNKAKKQWESKFLSLRSYFKTYIKQYQKDMESFNPYFEYLQNLIYCKTCGREFRYRKRYLKGYRDYILEIYVDRYYFPIYTEEVHERRSYKSKKGCFPPSPLVPPSVYYNREYCRKILEEKYPLPF